MIKLVTCMFVIALVACGGRLETISQAETEDASPPAAPAECKAITLEGLHEGKGCPRGQSLAWYKLDEGGRLMPQPYCCPDPQ